MLTGERERGKVRNPPPHTHTQEVWPHNNPFSSYSQLLGFGAHNNMDREWFSGCWVGGLNHRSGSKGSRVLTIRTPASPYFFFIYSSIILCLCLLSMYPSKFYSKASHQAASQRMNSYLIGVYWREQC